MPVLTDFRPILQGDYSCPEKAIANTGEAAWEGACRITGMVKDRICAASHDICGTFISI